MLKFRQLNARPKQKYAVHELTNQQLPCDILTILTVLTFMIHCQSSEKVAVDDDLYAAK